MLSKQYKRDAIFEEDDIRVDKVENIILSVVFLMLVHVLFY